LADSKQAVIVNRPAILRVQMPALDYEKGREQSRNETTL